MRAACAPPGVRPICTRLSADARGRGATLHPSTSVNRRARALARASVACRTPPPHSPSVCRDSARRTLIRAHIAIQLDERPQTVNTATLVIHLPILYQTAVRVRPPLVVENRRACVQTEDRRTPPRPPAQHLRSRRPRAAPLRTHVASRQVTLPTAAHRAPMQATLHHGGPPRTNAGHAAPPRPTAHHGRSGCTTAAHHAPMQATPHHGGPPRTTATSRCTTAAHRARRPRNLDGQLAARDWGSRTARRA